MQQSPLGDSNSSSAKQKVPCTLCNTDVHYCVHNIPPLAPILRQINPFHALPTDVFYINFNIILLSTPKSSKLYFFLKFPYQNPVSISPLPHTCHIPRPSNSSSFYQPDNI